MAVRKLFFDIETVPAPKALEPQLRELYERKRQKAGAEKAPRSFKSFAGLTSFDGTFGRIACLAYAVDDGPVEALAGSEREILEGFWSQATPTTRFVGHNIFDFDLPFVLKRTRILGVKPSVVPSLARYRSHPVYDTMHEWTGWGRTGVALHTLAVALGLPTSKDDIDGSQVAPYYAAGRIAEIVEYCKKDVVLTRQVYQKMTFNDTIPKATFG